MTTVTANERAPPALVRPGHGVGLEFARAVPFHELDLTEEPLRLGCATVKIIGRLGPSRGRVGHPGRLSKSH